MERDPNILNGGGIGTRKKIKVAFIIGSAEVGGAEHLLLSLIRSLPVDEFECSVICPSSGPMVARYAHVAARVGVVVRQSFLDPRAIITMASLLRQWSVDVVHTSLYLSDVGGILAARLARVRRVVSHIVGYNFYVTEERGWRRARKRFFSRLYRAIYALSDELIAVSQAVKLDLVARPGIKVRPGKIVVIRHSLSDEDTAAVSAQLLEEIKRRYGLNGGSVVISTIASLIPLKGHRYLVEALPTVVGSIPNLRCVIVGDGPSRLAIEQLVHRLGMNDHAVFTGMLDDAERNAILQLSRLVVLPSLIEGFPVVLLEAMAFRKPVVAAEVGGVPELVEDRVSGILVQPGDPAALAAAILSVVSDQRWAEQLGRAARRRFDESFSFDEMRDQLRGVLAR